MIDYGKNMQEGDVSGFMRGFASERKRMREREREEKLLER